MRAIQPLNNETTFNNILTALFRVSSCASLGVFVTGGLLFLMYSLIAMDPPELVITSHNVVPVIMPEERKIDVRPETMEVKPVDPTPPPPMLTLTQKFDPVETILTSIAPPVDTGIEGINGGLSSGTAMAIFKVAPQYPRRAQARGIEGFVDLMFDITPTGKTENIRVIYAEPQGMFDRSSIQALAKWKYKPAMDEGVAMVQKNQTTRISYELEI